MPQPRNIFTDEQTLTHHLILHSCDITNPGLLYGRLGIALVLEEYAMHNNLRPIRLLAERIVEVVLDNLSEKMPLEMASGLCGVGWGVEYLIQKGFMKGDSLDICEVIDKRIIFEDISRMDDMSLDTGLEGVLHYVLAHMQGVGRKEEMPFPMGWLLALQERLQEILTSGIQAPESLRHLICIYMRSIQSGVWQYGFNLCDLVRMPAKQSRSVLNLRNGLAGYVALKLFTRQEA